MSQPLDRGDFVRIICSLYEDPGRARTAVHHRTFEDGVIAACQAIQSELLPATCGPNGWQRNCSSGDGYDLNAVFQATLGDGNSRRSALRTRG